MPKIDVVRAVLAVRVICVLLILCLWCLWSLLLENVKRDHTSAWHGYSGPTWAEYENVFPRKRNSLEEQKGLGNKCQRLKSFIFGFELAWNFLSSTLNFFIYTWEVPPQTSAFPTVKDQSCLVFPSGSTQPLLCPCALRGVVTSGSCSPSIISGTGLTSM